MGESVIDRLVRVVQFVTDAIQFIVKGKDEAAIAVLDMAADDIRQTIKDLQDEEVDPWVNR